MNKLKLIISARNELLAQKTLLELQVKYISATTYIHLLPKTCLRTTYILTNLFSQSVRVLHQGRKGRNFKNPKKILQSVQILYLVEEMYFKNFHTTISH